MKLSAPVYILKSQAKEFKKSSGISMSDALNKVAAREGFNSWSLLMSKSEDCFPRKYSELLGFLNNGDLALIAARPGVGKTTFALGLFAQAIEEARAKGFCFTLVESTEQLAGRISTYNKEFSQNDGLYWLNCSNDICADYIILKARDKLQPGSLIIIDYLQLLDQKRSNPPVEHQVEQLKIFAKEKKCIIIFLCQLDRKVDSRRERKLTLNDIRLPNPLNLSLFNKILFLTRDRYESGEAEVSITGRVSHVFKVHFDLHGAKFLDC